MKQAAEIRSIALSLPATAVAQYSACKNRTFYMRCKRVFDIVLATAALSVCLPALLLICLAVICESPGAPIFRQRRYGAGGTVFNIYKIRTMRQNMANVSCVTVEADSRVTKIGSILRATKLDELPQLINILLGDMSVIGARPLSVDECQYLQSEHGYSQHTPGFIPQLKPGLIGLEQIHRTRKLSYSERFDLNALYEQSLCWQLDADIFMQSVIHCRIVVYAVLMAFMAELTVLAFFK